MLTILVDLVLADKFVAQDVLDLIVSKTELIIAKSAKSKEEMMRLAVEGAEGGCASFAGTLLPCPWALVLGVSSALARPTFGGIPLTQRGVAGGVIVWGGV
ncbi:uncharacterized protein LACBIDRAFT_306633 [Laccaria bicolor S238N-H82]|uniref:Predicted protein n=1 Tax=Laccaria bicolor (strain S238N-H82 / ATCC MYA-4686) TaxID=486041 RepID=B0DNH0_LACBS|nr:uncharacterized protein LACBIDRAFT_306633 [Laccaria bicolor S238N-H82]EDR03938.1 predicted protein [Laccaria bicolor S238N-H82]|eukprot:XP_001885506.1 predicted protein [Laccaria bicolor S238N-H82]